MDIVLGLFLSWNHFIFILEEIVSDFTIETRENNFCKRTQTETCQNEELKGNSSKFFFAGVLVRQNHLPA
jgi:hypothetical protein